MSRMNDYLTGLDVYNEVEHCWDELENRAFTAKYKGRDKLGSEIKPGYKISRLTCGGYVIIAPDFSE